PGWYRPATDGQNPERFVSCSGWGSGWQPVWLIAGPGLDSQSPSAVRPDAPRPRHVADRAEWLLLHWPEQLLSESVPAERRKVQVWRQGIQDSVQLPDLPDSRHLLYDSVLQL